MPGPTQPLLVSQRTADTIIKTFGKLPPEIQVYPSLRTSWPFECVWLRALGDFAHIHPVSQPCPYRGRVK